MIPWRLKAFLFSGWYVAVLFGGGHYIRRVWVDGDGDPYVTLYGTHFCLRNKVRYGSECLWHPMNFSMQDFARVFETPKNGGELKSHEAIEHKSIQGTAQRIRREWRVHSEVQAGDT